VAEYRDGHLARVTLLAVVGLVVALCLPSAGQRAASDTPGGSTPVVVAGAGGSGT
jgi:hypothetical protein